MVVGWSQVVVGLVLGVLALLVFEQCWYRWQGWWYGCKGPNTFLVTPLIGSIVQMVQDPYSYWHWHFDQRPVRSWNTLLSRFMVILPSMPDATRVFRQCGAGTRLYLHPNAQKLLAPDNLAFLNGEPHRALRRHLLPLFTTKALAGYLPIQHQTIHKHISSWLLASSSSSSSKDQLLTMRELVFAMNIDASTSVFLGEHLKSSEKQQLIHEYQHLTAGFLHLPFGHVLNRAIQARSTIVAILQQVVDRAKDGIGGHGVSGHGVSVLDNWIREQDASVTIDSAKMGGILLDFIFASQDASTSSITWVIHLLSEHRDVWQTLKQHVHKLETKSDKWLEEAMCEPYVNAVSKEILRYRPPATMVPHEVVAQNSVTLDDASKAYLKPGTLLVPSIWAANRFGLSDGDQFRPERWLKETNKPPFLTFGTGPHACLGYNYALNQIRLFIVNWCLLIRDWTRDTSNPTKSQQINYISTIYPADDCKIHSLQSL